LSKEQGENVKYLQKLISRKFYRSTIFWGLLLITIYTLGGFIALPKYINKTIVAQVEQQLGWQTKIEKIEFNPYNFTFSIDNLEISDQQQQSQIAFSRFYINFELRSIIEGAFTFADINLVDPNINVNLDKNGVSNFQHAIQRQQSKNPPEVTAEETTESELVKLLFDNINLVNGNINIVDNSPAQPVTYQLHPISFNLKDFFTFGDKEGSYHLDISLGKEQNITWDGTLGITPIQSKGSLKISGIRVQDFWEYLSEQVPYTLKQAFVGISGEYEFSMANEPMQLHIRNANVQVKDIKVANKSAPNSFADIKSINVGPIDFSLAEQKVQIADVKIDSLGLKVNRDKQGIINLLAPFANQPEQNTAETTNTETTTKSTFKWAVNNIALNDSQVDFIDKQPSTDAAISINNINFDVKGVSQDLSQSLPFNLAYAVDQAGNTKINGNVTATPLNLQAHVSLKDLSLPIIQPYLTDLAKIKLEQGKLSVEGDINFSNDETGQIAGDFQGGFDINEFNTKDTIINQRLIGWQNLAINPIKVNFNPLSIAINEIAINKPYARLVITQDRSMNLAQLAKDTETNTAKAQTTTPAEKSDVTVEKSADSKPLPITIDKISITNGDAYFADLSLKPQFATSIEKINGKINGLSSDNLARADVDIDGNIEEYGKMKVAGKINPLSGDLYTDLNVIFDKIELAPMTPYSGRYVGYSIDKGKLSLTLNYKIAKNSLNAKNHLVLDQFTLGNKIKSDEAISLPLKLALALFTDKDGVIDIKLPITGDMNSPDFAIGGILMKAFVNLITKAVTSPFSMVANLVGGDPDKLKSVDFAPGDATLSASNIEQLTTLAEVLKNRPKLALEIRPYVDIQEDTLALQQQKMGKLLIQSGINNSIELQQRVNIIEGVLPTFNGSNELNKLKLAMQDALLATDKDPDKVEKQQLIQNKYEQSLKNVLKEKQPIAELELTELAQRRLNAIKNQLIQQEKVTDTQIFALQPSLKGKAQENGIATLFTLTSQ
jgi:hypothetical protein